VLGTGAFDGGSSGLPDPQEKTIYFMETTACYAERRERRKRKPSIGHVRTLRSKGSKGPIKDRSIELNEANGVILRSTFDQTFVRALPNPSIDEIEGFEDVRGVPRRPPPRAPITD
jgi:hypothetical protein